MVCSPRSSHLVSLGITPRHSTIRARVIPSPGLLLRLVPLVRVLGRRWGSPLTLCLRRGRLVSLWSWKEALALFCAGHIMSSRIHASIALAREACGAPWPLVPLGLSIVLHCLVYMSGCAPERSLCARLNPVLGKCRGTAYALEWKCLKVDAIVELDTGRESMHKETR